MNTTTDTARWFELLDDAAFVAHYIDDTTSEVYAMRADAPTFARVREDDGMVVVTLLTNDRAELIAGEARLSYLSEAVIAATIGAMLS